MFQTSTFCPLTKVTELATKISVRLSYETLGFGPFICCETLSFLIGEMYAFESEFFNEYTQCSSVTLLLHFQTFISKSALPFADLY